MAAWQGSPADLLDDLGNAIAEQYRQIADALEEKLRRALNKAIDEPPDTATRLRVARELEQQARTLVATMPPDQVASVVASIVSGEASAEIARQLLQIPALAGSTVTAGGLWAVAAVEIELRDTLRALNERILRAPADIYRQITARSVGQILAGRSTWEQVQRRQVDEYLAQGIAGFVDKSGRRWRIGSYAEMATRTAAARAWRDQSIASMANAGIETFRPVIGSDACAECAAWAGKVLTDGGPVGALIVPHAITAEPAEIVVDGTLADARAAGWGHPNCRCVLVAALPGLTSYRLTTHDPEHEAARDQMRALERDVRAAKRDDDAAGVKAAQAALKDHTRKHKLNRRYWREQLAFAGG